MGKSLLLTKGDYDTYERTRIELVKNQQKAFEANERSRAHMQVFSSYNNDKLMLLCLILLLWYLQRFDNFINMLPIPTLFCSLILIALEKVFRVVILCLFRPVITNLIFMVNIFFRLVLFFSGIFCSAAVCLKHMDEIMMSNYSLILSSCSSSFWHMFCILVTYVWHSIFFSLWSTDFYW